MKRILYILAGLVGLVALAAVGGIIYLNTAFPKVDAAPDITIERTAERIARGEYLAKNVSLCFDCHSTKDYKYFSGPPVEGTWGKGGEMIPGAPGAVYASNITPAALGDWTDGEILQAITTGVSKDGRPLLPMMPYPEYRYMTTEDAYAIVAYLRTIEPIENDVPISTANFPLNLIFRTVPENPEPTPTLDPADVVGKGKYLARIGGCFFCHSPIEQGMPIPGQEFSGGHEFVLPGFGVGRAPNLTADNETGIGTWSKEDFVTRFKAYSDSTFQLPTVAKGDVQSPMPWMLLKDMTEDDLGAIYEYLRTLPAIHHTFDRFTPETD